MKELPIYPAEDIKLDGMVLAILQPTSSNGDFKLVEAGRGFVPSQTGISVVIEDKHLMQIDKFKLEMDELFRPKLVLKEGEVFEEIEEDYLTIRERELKNELLKIQAQKQKEVESSVDPEL